MKMKCRTCGFDPVAVQSQLKDYLKGDPLPDEKFFIELDRRRSASSGMLPASWATRRARCVSRWVFVGTNSLRVTPPRLSHK
jgi:hypothetical protein